MSALILIQRGQSGQNGQAAGPNVPLDEALAWANLSFLALFLGAVVVVVVMRRRSLRPRDRTLYALLALLLSTLLVEYDVRRTSYAVERDAEQEYELTERYANQALVLGVAAPGWDPVQEARELLQRRRSEGKARMLRTQSVTTVLFALFAAGIGLCVLERRGRAEAWTAAALAAGVAFAVARAWPLWRIWPDGSAATMPSESQAALISVGPGIAMAALGAALVREYRRLASLLGVLLSLGVILYGALQLSEIGERRLEGERALELYRVAMLSLAFGLRLATVAAIVKLPLVRESRAQIQRWMARVPGGAALATLRADRVLEIHQPDDVTAQLPLVPVRRGREDVYELHLTELEGEWGTRITPPGAGSVEYLASPPDGLALYRVLLIPLPARFLGGDHLLLTFEAESVVRILPRARLGLALLRAGSPDVGAGEMRVWWCNDHVGRLFGAPPADLCGRRLESLVHPDWRPRLGDVRRDDYSSVLAAVATDSAGPGERAGEFVRITACPFGDAAALQGAAADAEPTEMLLVMVSSLSSDSHTHTDFLLHNLAHTLRTPVQLVRGALERVVGDLDAGPSFDPVDALGRLRRARAEATRLEHVVDLNLQVGRDLIERGEEPELFPLESFVRDEVLGVYTGLAPEELAPVVRSNRGKLRAFHERVGGYLELSTDGSGEVCAHRAPLKVMLRELIENALHYSRADGPPPRIEVTHSAAGGLVTIENEVEPAELDQHGAGLVRESQGLSCVRFLSVRYGHPFRIAIDHERGSCVATVAVGRASRSSSLTPEPTE